MSLPTENIDDFDKSGHFPVCLSSDNEDTPFLDMGDENDVSTSPSVSYRRMAEPDSNSATHPPFSISFSKVTAVPVLIASVRKSHPKLTAVIFASLVVGVIIVVAVVAAMIPRGADGNDGDFPYKQVRLPRTLIPETYDLFLHPNLTTDKYIGHVVIKIRVAQATSSIFLHMKALNLTKSPDVRPTESKREQVVLANTGVTETLTDDDLDMLYIGLVEEVQEGQRYNLTLHFEGKLSEGLDGIYKSRYTTATGEERFIATTQFEPTAARKAFPCFDEPDMKSHFALTMIRDKDHKTLFNMPLDTSQPYLDTDLMMDKFDFTFKMSTYLVAFIVCDFEYTENITSSGVNVRVYAPSDQIHEATFSVATGAKVLSHYEEFFNVPYPLPKQDMVAIPDFSAGAMENWGLITYRLTAILYEKGVSSEHDLQWVAIVIAHELAHQWFGNLVTMEWWNDLWLNEGFASFVEYIGVDFVKPEWQMMDQFIYMTLQTALAHDALSNSHPISVPVSNPDQINEIFDSISYSKGASILRMLENFLSRDVFTKGLTDYLQSHAYSNAKTDDLWQALTKADHDNGGNNDVKTLMDTWTLQMGYPVVTLTRNGRTVTATQQRFLINPDGEPSTEYKSPFDYKWIIPFTYITSSEPSKPTSQLLKFATVKFSVPDDAVWFKGNVNATGFYRVNYDTDSWDAIIQQLQSDHTVFTSSDRTSFIDDIFHFARARHVSQSKALDLSLYLNNEEDYVPLATAISNLEYIGSALFGRDSYAMFKKYVLQQFRRIINKVGWDDTGTHIERFRRTVVLAMADSYDLEAAVQNSVVKFNRWMTQGIQISPNFKSIIYCSGVRNGGEEEFNFIWQKYNTTVVPSEVRKLLSALACTKDPKLLQRLLDWSLDKTKVRTQDTVSVIVGVAANPYKGLTIAWQFLMDKWDELHKRYEGDAFIMVKFIKGVAPRFKTQEDLEMVKNFFANHPDAGSGTRTIHQCIETIQINIDWLQRHEQEVTDWLTNQVGNPRS
ncbi:endoplasmic reticulum aminopeptidase 1-like [Glandiceps talaboti]